MIVTDYFGTEIMVIPYRKKYAYKNNLAIYLETDDGEPYAQLTVNLGTKLGKDLAFVDTNNCPWAEEFIKTYELGEPMGAYGSSGFCTYPLYRFRLDKIVEA